MMRNFSDIAEDTHLAEASAWLSRLQGPNRSAAVEAAFKAWLAESPTHARAYARVADIWDIIPGAAGLNRRVQAAALRSPRRAHRPARLAAAAACVLVLVAGLGWWQLHVPIYQTAIGEVKLVTLADGTRLTLNTDTRLAVDFDSHQRLVRLERGEAIFEDVNDPRRPFIVQAKGHQVRALGTTFQVRIDRENLAVMLMDGKVAVSRDATRDDSGNPAPTILAPGERLVLRSDGHATVDHPSLEALTAWQRGEVVFDNVTMARAIDEINRYGGMHVRLGDPALAQMRVSGVFSVHDPLEFAHALAKLQHLQVTQSGRDITIWR